MAINHINVKTVSKGKGQSACASASYIAGEEIKSEVLNKTFNNKKPEVVYSNILLCENAPDEYRHRATLWNSVEKNEKNENGQLARMFILALPRELTLDQKIELVNAFAKTNFTDKGMIADISIHDKGDGNPHAHIMTTVREIDENGKWMAKRKTQYKRDENDEKVPVIDPKTQKQKIGKKDGRKTWEREDVFVNNWSTKETLVEWRRSWAEEQNKYLDKDNQVDHRTLKAQGIDREPTRHIGYHKGVKNVIRLAENEEITQANQSRYDTQMMIEQLAQTQRDIFVLHGQTQELKTEIKKDEEEFQNVFNGAKTRNAETTEERLRRRERILGSTGGEAGGAGAGDGGSEENNSDTTDDTIREALAVLNQITNKPAGETGAAIIEPGQTMDRIDEPAIIAAKRYRRLDSDQPRVERSSREHEQQRVADEREADRVRQAAESIRIREKRMRQADIDFDVPTEQREKDDRER